MRLGIERIALAVALVTTISCSDDSFQDGGGRPDTSAGDGISGLPDGYGPLWPCDVPGQTCNPHDPCAINPLCGQDRMCRPSSLQSCDDELDCTDDICQGMGLCENKPRAGLCALPVRVGAPSDGGGGQTVVRCFKKDDKNPDDPCLLCNPDNDSSKWSPANGGFCNDDNDCTKDDYCSEGQCKGTYYGTQCADEFGCTDDLCDGKGGCLGNPLRSDWCLINNVCHKDGVMDPAGSCNTCDVSNSQTDWTPVTNTCLINNVCYKAGAPHPQGCATCDPATSTTAWTPTSTSCAIGYNCFTAAAVEPGGCGVCDATKNKTGWTKPSGCQVVYSWSRGFGSTSSDYGYGVATDSAGNVYITGYFYNSADFGGGPLTSKGSTDIFVASFTPGGVHRWSKSFGNTSSDYGYGIAVDGSGNVYVTGYFYNSVDFGGGALTSAGSGDIFVASFTSSGAHRWSKAFGSTSSDYGYGVATDGSGNVYISGYFYSSVNFGGGALTSAGSGDIFIASFTSTGAHRWSKGFGGTSSDYGYDVATDSSGNVYLTGYFYNTLDFGGGPLTSKGSYDAYIASFTSTGAHRWSKSFGGTSSDYGYAVAVDASANVYVTGRFYSSADFGGGTIADKGGGDIYIASYTSTGTHRWSKGFGGTSSDYGYGVGVDTSGNVYITGYFYTGIDFGGGALTSNGSYDIYVASLTSTGAYRWARSHGSSSSDLGRAVTADGSGNVYVVGNFYNSVDLGGGEMTSSGGQDVFLLKLTP